jgi:heat shock protein HslJ
MELNLTTSVRYNETKTLEIKMKKAFLLAIALFILTACSSGSNTSADFTGEWKLISYGDASNPTPAIPNVDTSIKFDSNGRVSGNVGCNGFGGNYKMNGDKITFNSIVSTMMYCEDTSLQEQIVLGVFSDNVKLQIQRNNDTLTITSADGSSVVNFARK